MDKEDNLKISERDLLRIKKRKEFLKEIEKIYESDDPEIPDNYKKYYSEFGHLFGEPNSIDMEMMMEVRRTYCTKISWCLITNEWLDKLANFLSGKTCLEFYSGLGMLSYQLRKRGIDVTPVDDGSWTHQREPYLKPEYNNIEESIKVYYDNEKKLDYVICSWIPYNDNCDWVYLLKEKYPNCKIVFIGEVYGNSASDEFFDKITADESASKFVEEIDHVFPKWDGMHDQVTVYKIDIKGETV